MNLRRVKATQRAAAARILITVILTLICIVSAPCTQPGKWTPIPLQTIEQSYPQVFRFDTSGLPEKPLSVHLAGSFNHFSHDLTPMRDDGRGMFSVTLQLPPGLYHYKFLVDGEHWFTDPSADPKLQDMQDHHNSGVIVGPDSRRLPPPKENHIEFRAITHNPSDPNNASVAPGSILRLHIHAQADDVQGVTARYRAAGQDTWKQQELISIDHQLGVESFTGDLPVRGSQVEYIFELTDGAAKAYVASGMIYPSLRAAQAHPYLRSMKVSFQTPQWAQHAVWYQVFVERFRNGDASNDPPGTQRWQSKWYATLPGETPGEESFHRNLGKRRYGGDLQGLRQRLPYLRKLGVTALYLNPIFQADSLHKYDTRDYRHIDDSFGVARSSDELAGETDDSRTWKWSKSDLVFLDFLQDAHRQGFKVIIDGVFNHIGRSHPFFQDVLKNGQQSKYADWFEITDWGDGEDRSVRYLSWNGRNGGMPLLKKDAKLGLAPGPREHILAIVRRWMAPDGDVSHGIDGWRLDAADRVPHPFWVDFRELVKSINPDAYICGEIWGWAQPWLQGDQFDAVMNYQFAIPSQSFFVDEKLALSPSQFHARLNKVFYDYPLQVVQVQQNLLDSHDTDRFVSRFLNPDRAFNQGDAATYKVNRPSAVDFARARQAVVLQMTFPGAPMVYYGDEAGMWSGNDPHDRMPMWWKDLEPFDDPEYQFNQDHFDFYQRVIAIRRQLPALQRGDFRSVLIDDARDVYAFARSDHAQTAYVVLNRSAAEIEVELPVPRGSFGNWLDPAEVEVIDRPEDRPALGIKPTAPLHWVEHGKVKLTLPAYGSAILSEREQATP
jgi:glycosidase